jgi:hypothetical protein
MHSRNLAFGDGIPAHDRLSASAEITGRFKLREGSVGRYMTEDYLNNSPHL